MDELDDVIALVEQGSIGLVCDVFGLTWDGWAYVPLGSWSDQCLPASITPFVQQSTSDSVRSHRWSSVDTFIRIT